MEENFITNYSNQKGQFMLHILLFLIHYYIYILDISGNLIEYMPNLFNLNKNVHCVVLQCSKLDTAQLGIDTDNYIVTPFSNY